MAKLLYIESSPRKDRSASIAVAKAFMEAYRSGHPKDKIETLDIWALDLPEFDGETINAKYKILHGQSQTASEAAAWNTVVNIFRKFQDADKYLLSLPMWNFGIPYKLKHFIDIIVQPGLSFSFSPKTGYTGLVAGKPAVVIYARGGEYSSGDDARARDFQKSYLEHILKFIGFTDIRSILVEPTLAAPEVSQKARAAAIAAAQKIAANF
ncbi:MAG: NAD(P)H-dependent oxidoreductase [Desulfobacterales bacterium]|nr:NAD(P)H-dependent oxidoreductase [Desulfobacterales bacterium]